MDVDSIKYDYDLIVIGGGSGGIACAKEAAAYGGRVALFDFVKPTNHGTKWGLGGTCVNVGCIPKKIMHYSGLLGDSLFDAHKLGWDVPSDHTQCKFSWETMSETVTNYIKSLNFKYKSSLLDADIHYYKAYASFIDPHTVEFTQRYHIHPCTHSALAISAHSNRQIAKKRNKRRQNISFWQWVVDQKSLRTSKERNWQ